MSWSFTKLVGLENARKYKMHLENSRCDYLETLTKSESVNEDNENHKRFSHKKLHSEGFIKDERLFIKCETVGI